jgi:carbamoyl-phosphate synthase large subunit
MRKIGLTGMSEKAPGISVARSIKVGCPDMHIVAFGEPMQAGMYIDVDTSYVVAPYDIDAIVKIASAKGVRAIIPNMDDDVEAFAESKEVFSEYGINLLIPDPNIVRIANDKLETYQYASSKSISMPETVRYSEELDWELPYFLKGGFCGVFKVRTREEAFVIAQYLKQRGERPVTQKNLDGEPYSVAGIAYDGDVVALMIKKLRIAENGTTIFGVTVYDEDLLSLTEDFVLGIGWEGPFEVEFIKDNDYHLLEMNSRFPSWIDVGVSAGLNPPTMLAEILFGQKQKIKIESYKYRTGVTFIKFPMTAITDIDKIVGMKTIGGVEWKRNNM